MDHREIPDLLAERLLFILMADGAGMEGEHFLEKTQVKSIVQQLTCAVG